MEERRRTLLAFVIALPLTFSGLIVAYGFILTYGRAGLVTQLLALLGADSAVLGKALFTPVGLAFASSYTDPAMGVLPVFVARPRAAGVAHWRHAGAGLPDHAAAAGRPPSPTACA
jgi:ABC-type spermidine/putrescine transport system permease subunit I